jgi:hypothetical protein
MKSTIIENSSDSFADFHDGDWIKEIFTLSDGSKIENIIEEFHAHWWGSSRMFVLPWLLVKGVRNASAVESEYTLDDVWAKYLNNNAFQGALWKIAENSYCSLYYAYENLLVAISLEYSDRKVRVTDRDFTAQLNNILGESITSKVWSSSKIILAKEIRNAIVHNGGKVTDKLVKLEYENISDDGDVSISASDTRDLYNMLKPLVKKLVKRVVAVNS